MPSRMALIRELSAGYRVSYMTYFISRRHDAGMGFIAQGALPRDERGAPRDTRHGRADEHICRAIGRARGDFYARREYLIAIFLAMLITR